SRIFILDDDGNEVPRGEIGEAVLGGDCIAAGYWSDEEATRASFTEMGWKSGDLGYVDEDGYLFIVDRKKDVIIAGGHNVYPLEMETVPSQHPAGAMCAVVGAPDEGKGEILVAGIVRSAGSAVTEAEIIHSCRENLAAYKAPRAVHFS